VTSITDWKAGGELYLPTLNDAEIEFGIPTDLLARIAFEESSWRLQVVNGTVKSSDGCVGLMQLNPVYYPQAGQHWYQDIQWAAELLADHYKRFQDWQVALAAYNDGAGNIDLWLKGDRPLPLETSNYVGQIVADVPVPGAIVPV
jgi:soluble lytic murein transglycosylase-like protein